MTIPVPSEQVPGVYHRRVGDIIVTVLSDGYIDATFEMVKNVTPAAAEETIRAQLGRVPPRIAVNAFVVNVHGRLALIDTGSGTTLGPTLGRLPQNLAAVGIAPDDIDTILLTHMHPDHSNGLTDDDGRPWFADAQVALHADDLAHWMDDGRMAQAKEWERPYFETARFQIKPYHDRLKLFRGGDVFPGVMAMPIPGHTPGHTAYAISSGSDSVLVWGDTVHIPDLQVPRPDVCMAFDTDPAAAAASRARVFDMSASDRLVVAGMHLHFPAFARMSRRNGGYLLTPEPWNLGL